MGGIVDTVGGLFGVGGAEDVNPLQYSPYDVNTPLGTVGASQGQLTAALSPELQNIFTGLLGQSQQQLQFAESPEQAAGFLRQSMQPQMEQQRLSQESRLYNQGLLGTTTGGLQTEALRRAQEQSIMQNALTAQQQAFQRGQGLLGSALNIAGAPSQLAGISGELGARQLQAAEGTEALRQQAEANQANFFSSLVSSGARAFGGFNQGGGVSSGAGSSASTLGSGSFLPNTQGFGGVGSFGPNTGSFYQFPIR